MSKYTTEVRFICETFAGYDESQGYSDMSTVIENSRGQIFDFDFPIFDENYRSVIETKILKHFYTREIGFETVGAWKRWLNMRMNEIMPYYNQLYNSELITFNPLYDTDYTTDADRTIDHNENTTSNRTDDLTRTDDLAHSDTASSSNESRDLYSDTPQGALTGVDNETYLTTARKVTGAESANSSGTNTGTVKNTGTQSGTGTDVYKNIDDYLEHVTGKRGTASYSKMLQEYRDTFLNIDLMVINELNDLFMNIW